MHEFQRGYVLEEYFLRKMAILLIVRTGGEDHQLAVLNESSIYLRN